MDIFNDWCCFGPWINVIPDDNAFSFSKFVQPTATLIAAFLGAWFAFKLQKREKQQKIKADNITAGNYAIYNVMCQYDTFHYISKQIIEPVRRNQLRIVLMQGIQPPIECEDLKPDLSSLLFFLKPQKSLELQMKLRKTMAELFIEYTRYQTVINAINNRTEFLSQKVQPLINEAKIRYYQDTPDQMQVGEEILSLPKEIPRALQYIEAALGHLVYQGILSRTDNVIKAVDEAKTSLLSMRDKLVDALKQLFPENERDILRFDPELN